jgi:hypothetical protein
MRRWFQTEDWWAVGIGLFVFALSLPAAAGVDLLGWAVATSGWVDIAKAMAPVSKAYTGLPGIASLALTYLFTLALMSVGAAALRLDLRKFVAGFSLIFAISYVCWLIGNYAHIAATPDKRGGFGITWSLGLTGEAGFIVALLAGLLLGNFFPQVVAFLKEGVKVPRK